MLAEKKIWYVTWHKSDPAKLRYAGMYYKQVQELHMTEYQLIVPAAFYKLGLALGVYDAVFE